MYLYGFADAIRISIHALLAESDRVGRPSHGGVHQFQSTLSLRRATGDLGLDLGGQVNFNPRSPCGERLSPRCSPRRCRAISIHALLAESDGAKRRLFLIAMTFQSTLSLRRATMCSRCHKKPRLISIHALLAESDYHSIASEHIITQFQSTLSLRRATQKPANYVQRLQNFNPRSPCGERPGIRGR